MSEPELTARVLTILATTCGISETDIMGARRSDEIVLARHLFIYIIRWHMGLGVSETARMLDKSPSAICASLQRSQFLLKHDRKTKRIYGQVVNRMAGVTGIK